MERARCVRIDSARLEELAAELAREPVAPPHLDPAHHYRGEASETLAYVVTLDAINFGSGYFPLLRKRPGLSGYFTLATGLRERFEAEGPWSAAELAALGARDCAGVLGQDLAVPELAELMDLFARALNDLGRWLGDRYGGRFEALVADAEGSAERLAKLLLEMPFYRDVSDYAGAEVFFLKRAQLTSADLAAAFGGDGYGRFHDLDRLTIFADNLVPHVLRLAGVLRYDPALLARIERGDLLVAGSPEELEIRAGAVHAVERLVPRVRELRGAAEGAAVTAAALDSLLWNRGQRPELKAHPRHRARTVFY